MTETGRIIFSDWSDMIENVSNVGMVVESGHVGLYQSVAEGFKGVTVTPLKDAHLPEGRSRIRILGTRNNDAFWEAIREGKAALSQEPLKPTGE